MLAQTGFRVTLLEQAERLEETGAGIQLSPNATRILIALGLGERLRADVFVPEAVAIKTASGSELARIPLGAEAERRYGAPYWAIHRGDLQAALLEAVRAQSRHRAAARHAGRRFRRACQRRQRRLPPRLGHRRRARHRADRRRRAVVGAARRGSGIARSRNSASAPPGARWFRPTRSTPNSARRRAALARAERASRPLSGEGRRADQHRRHRRRRLGASPAGAREGERDELLAHYLALALGAAGARVPRACRTAG